MKPDLEFLIFRVLVFGFLMTLVLLTFYLFGTYQSFLDSTLRTLFDLFRAFSWAGLGGALFFQLYLFSGKVRGRSRRFTNLLMLLVFVVLYGLVEFLKTWLYPEVG